jgi:hypothetical protein
MTNEIHVPKIRVAMFHNAGEPSEVELNNPDGTPQATVRFDAKGDDEASKALAYEYYEFKQAQLAGAQA